MSCHNTVAALFFAKNPISELTYIAKRTIITIVK